MIKPTVYLHIGMNKTGSTAIQFWMSDKREALVHSGFLYSETGEADGAHYDLSRDCGFVLGNKEGFDKSLIEDYRKSFKSELKQSHADTVLFSSENFVLEGSLEAVKYFFEGYRLKIIVYLRRHDYWWESLFAQFVKMVSNPPMEKGIEKYISFQKNHIKYHNYVSLLDKWAAVFGIENIIVRPYESEQMPEGIVVDIARVLGIDHLNVDFNDSKQNVSLDNKSTYILDIAQRAKLNKQEIGKLISFLRKNQDTSENRMPLLSPERRRDMIEYCSKTQYEYIADRYLSRSDGKLFYEPLPEDKDWVPFVPPKVDEVVTTVSKALGLIED